MLGYCLALVLAALLGGWLPERLRLTHTRIQLVMSFIAGLMLGVGFFHLLPHSISHFPGEDDVHSAIGWLIVGLISMLLLLRLFHFHQHDYSTVAHQQLRGQLPQTVSELALDQGKKPVDTAHPTSWVGVALGLTIHSLVDGLALGAAVSLDAAGLAVGGNSVALLGLGVFLAILLHKPLDSMSIVTLMTHGGWSRRNRQLFNLVFAFICPLGALMFVLLGQDMTVMGTPVLPVVMAFAAGAFICIALSDLLPEVQFHSHDRVKLSVAFVLGLALAYALWKVETSHIGPAHEHLAINDLPQAPWHAAQPD